MTHPGSAGTAGPRFRTPPPTVPVPREQSDPAEPGRRTQGRHRGPPPPSNPKAPTVIAVAAAVLTAASLTAIAGAAVAPDATAASRVSPVTRAERTTAGPLEVPTIGAEGAWSPPEEAEPAVRPVTVARTPVRTRRPASTVRAAVGTLGTLETASQQAVTPAPQPVTTPPADASPPTVAAATTDSSATPTEEPVMTPTESPVTVDVTAEVTGP
jgi:hypothetical protein